MTCILKAHSGCCVEKRLNVVSSEGNGQVKVSYNSYCKSLCGGLGGGKGTGEKWIDLSNL